MTDVAFTLKVWHLLAVLTTVAWVTFIVWPRQTSTGYGAIGDGIMNFIAALMLLTASLVMWLAYLMSPLQ